MVTGVTVILGWASLLSSFISSLAGAHSGMTYRTHTSGDLMPTLLPRKDTLCFLLRQMHLFYFSCFRSYNLR